MVTLIYFTSRFNHLRNKAKFRFLMFFVPNKIDNPEKTGACDFFQGRLCVTTVIALSIFLSGCQKRNNSVSGTIEVDEVHVGPRSGGRVEKIFAWEGDTLRTGQPIVQLDASELHARRDLAEAQINTAIHDADAQDAQLQFLRDDAKRQKDLLQRKVVSPNDAERADSAAKAQDKNLGAAKMRVTQARAQLADIDAQLAEMQVIAPSDSVLEVLSVKVGDVPLMLRGAQTKLSSSMKPPECPLKAMTTWFALHIRVCVVDPMPIPARGSVSAMAVFTLNVVVPEIESVPQPAFHHPHSFATKLLPLHGMIFRPIARSGGKP